jgi:iron(III) transport system ATP-binding protein
MAAGERRQPGITVTGLTKYFTRRGSDEQVRAIDDVSFEVGPGEMLVLLGPSGCGKTTLLRCLAGLEPPDVGEIKIGDKVVFSSERKVQLPPRARNVSMIFQSYSLWPHMTVNQNIAYPLRNRGIRDRSRIRGSVQRVLEQVGLDTLGQEYPGTLSGGQQQRISLARALVADPAAVLFDEPLSNVDARVRIRLRQEIRTMHSRVGFVGVYVTHDQEEALSIATRIAVLDSGRVLQLGTPQEIYERPATGHVATFVGGANTYPATVAGVSDGADLEISTPIGTLAVAQDGAPPGLATGSAAQLVIRPEDIGLLTTASPSMQTVEGVVRSHDYRGHSYELTIAVGEETVRCGVTGRSDMPEVGAAVWMSLRPDRLRLVPA